MCMYMNIASFFRDTNTDLLINIRVRIPRNVKIINYCTNNINNY